MTTMALYEAILDSIMPGSHVVTTPQSALQSVAEDVEYEDVSETEERVESSNNE